MKKILLLTIIILTIIIIIILYPKNNQEKIIYNNKTDIEINVKYPLYKYKKLNKQINTTGDFEGGLERRG